MSETFNFTTQLNPSESEGRMTARIVPFGAEVPYGQESIRFERGGLEMPATVPLTVDHGDSVLDRIGVMTSFAEADDGAYATFEFSDTSKAQDVRTLLGDGAVTDVSIGVSEFQVTDGVMTGVLDHTAVVTHGRFGKTTNPSRVLSVHDEGEPPMAETQEAAVEVATHDIDEKIAQFDELAAAVTRLEDKLDTMENRVVKEPALFRSVGDYFYTKLLAADGERDAADKMAKHAMSADTTTTGTGAVPDYLINEMIEVLRTERAFTNSVRSIDPGPYGMTTSMPAWGTEPTVTAQSSEFDQPSSTTTSVGTNDVDLVTYTGANRISLQLARRSSPDFIDGVIRHLISAYNKVTDAAGILAVHTAATGAHTAVLADLSNSASATFAAFQTANAAIITDLGRPADTLWLAPDKWAELNALVDSAGRPLLVYPDNGPSNAQGQSGLNMMVGQYHGWTVRLVPDAAAATVLIGIANQAAVFEDATELLRVTNVDTTSIDVGVMGLYAADALVGNAFYTITES